LVQAVGLLGIVATALFAGSQWKAMVESNRLNRLGIEAVQRAFVSSTGYIVDGTPERGIRFKVGWKNTGHTATKRTATRVNILVTPNTMPVDFNFSDTAETQSPLATFLLAPDALEFSSHSDALSDSSDRGSFSQFAFVLVGVGRVRRHAPHHPSSYNDVLP